MSSASPWPRPFSYFLSPKGLGREAKGGGLAGPPAAERAASSGAVGRAHAAPRGLGPHGSGWWHLTVVPTGLPL